jgi:hypothetical protein
VLNKRRAIEAEVQCLCIFLAWTLDGSQPLSLRYRLHRELGGPKGRPRRLGEEKERSDEALLLQELARTSGPHRIVYSVGH